MHRTLVKNWRPLANTTTRIGFINHWPETRQRSLAVILDLNALTSATIPGHQTATDFFKRQLPRDLPIRLGQAPNLSTADRFLMGFWSLFLRPGRIAKVAVSIRPSTLLKFHQCLVRRKYRRLFSLKKRTKPGPKGPAAPLIRASVVLKRRNPRFGCPRIPLIISKTFGVEIDKNVVRRIRVKHYHPDSGASDPSWLSLLGHMKDSLGSVDLFRCESITLTSHWVLLVMDQFTRRIIGFGVHAGDVDGIALCRMCNRIIASLDRNRHAT